MPDVRPSLAHNLTKLLNRVRARGPREVWDLAYSRVRENLWSDDDLVVFLADAGGASPHSGDLRLERAQASDAESYARDIGTESPSTFAARLSPTSLCFLVRDERRIVHSSWVALVAAWTRELRGYVAPPEGDAYVYESFTRADARGQGVYPFALHGIRASLGAEGVRKVWVAAEADNPASVRAITKAGFVETGRITYRRRFGSLKIARSDDGDSLRVTKRLPR